MKKYRYTCPKCGGHQLSVEYPAEVVVTDFGDDSIDHEHQYGDIEYTLQSDASCTSCDWHGTLGLAALRDYPVLTVAGLRRKMEAANTETHYFSRENMRFAGDTMGNYAVSKPQVITTYHGDAVVYELRRKRPVKHGLQSSAYFDAETFTQRWPK